MTDKAGVATPCFANGGAVGDYNNDGWPDLYITCLGANVLYRNNGDGTFTDVTVGAGVGDPRNSTGAAFGDYDKDGYVDLMVTNYVDFDFNNLPGFGKLPICKFRGVDVQCGPRGLKGAGDTLYHNNGDGTFSDVSKQAGVDDPNGYYGLGLAWVDFNNTGKLDLFIANDATPNYLYRNEGNGKFSEIGLESGVAVSADGTEQACMGVAIGDYNHTGRPSSHEDKIPQRSHVTVRQHRCQWQSRSTQNGEPVPRGPFAAAVRLPVKTECGLLSTCAQDRSPPRRIRFQRAVRSCFRQSPGIHPPFS